MATKQYIYDMKRKLPHFLFWYILDGRLDEILLSMYTDEVEVLEFLSASKFPTDDQLKGFCNHFCLSYSTLKTWNVLHLDDE